MERKTCHDTPEGCLADGGASSSLRVLLVGGDMPSHVIAVAKLALWLSDAGHDVTFAVPGEATAAAAAKEVKGSRVAVRQAGRSLVEKQVNVHGSVDSQSWEAMIKAVRNPPMVLIDELEGLMAPVYEQVLQLIEELRPDVLVHNHAMFSPAGDAAEKAGLPVVSFVHLPYDPALHMGYESSWQYPRMVPFFPHVATYSARSDQGLYRRCWQWVDALFGRMSWTSERAQALRRERGLPPAPCDFASYHARHPCVVLGGPPFGPAAPVPPLTAVVGHVEREPQALPPSLAAWMQAGPDGVVLISMGTGQTLTPDEAREIARGLGREVAAGGSGGAAPRLLWALRQSQQEELLPVLEEELGKPELERRDGEPEGRAALLFLGGAVRVEHFLPQYAVLCTGRVRLFLTHMGFGAFVEAVRCAVPVLCHPGGFDQEHNATRAIDAGFGQRAPAGLRGLAAVARRCMADEAMQAAAVRAQRQLEAMGGGGMEAVRAVERFARLSREDAAALRPALASAAAAAA